MSVPPKRMAEKYHGYGNLLYTLGAIALVFGLVIFILVPSAPELVEKMRGETTIPFAGFYVLLVRWA